MDSFEVATSISVVDSFDPIKTDLLDFVNPECPGCSHLKNEIENLKTIIKTEFNNLHNLIVENCAEIKQQSIVIERQSIEIKQQSIEIKQLIDLKRFVNPMRKVYIRKFLVDFRDFEHPSRVPEVLRIFLEERMNKYIVSRGNEVAHGGVSIEYIAEAIESKRDGQLKDAFRELFLILYGSSTIDNVNSDEDD